MLATPQGNSQSDESLGTQLSICTSWLTFAKGLEDSMKSSDPYLPGVGWKYAARSRLCRHTHPNMELSLYIQYSRNPYKACQWNVPENSASLRTGWTNGRVMQLGMDCFSARKVLGIKFKLCLLFYICVYDNNNNDNNSYNSWILENNLKCLPNAVAVQLIQWYSRYHQSHCEQE